VEVNQPCDPQCDAYGGAAERGSAMTEHQPRDPPPGYLSIKTSQRLALNAFLPSLRKAMLAGRVRWPALNACFKIPKVEAHLPMEGENTSVGSTMKPRAHIRSNFVLSVTDRRMPCQRYTHMNRYSSRAWSRTCWLLVSKRPRQHSNSDKASDAHQ
jgi:hypothetical protein